MDVFERLAVHVDAKGLCGFKKSRNNERDRGGLFHLRSGGSTGFYLIPILVQTRFQVFSGNQKIGTHLFLMLICTCRVNYIEMVRT